MKRILFILLLCSSLPTSASSVSIISNSDNAQACSRAAILASKKLDFPKNSLEKCLRAISNAKLSRRDKAASLVNRAVILMQSLEYSLAYKDLVTAKNMYPSMGAIYVNIGNIFYLGEAYAKALENYNLAIEYELPELHIAYLNRGMVYKAMENPVAALKDFHKAAELAPEWDMPAVKIQGLLPEPAPEMSPEVTPEKLPEIGQQPQEEDTAVNQLDEAL
jgi:tetratricopeptide (TPR) repeat protein